MGESVIELLAEGAGRAERPHRSAGVLRNSTATYSGPLPVITARSA